MSQYARAGAKVLLLNMGAQRGGGGVEKGASCQEEELYRRTDLGTAAHQRLCRQEREGQDGYITKDVALLRAVPCTATLG